MAYFMLLWALECAVIYGSRSATKLQKRYCDIFLIEHSAKAVSTVQVARRKPVYDDRRCTSPLGVALSASRAKKRVLIVDDDKNEALLLRSLMQANGYKPILAGSKPEGVRRAERDKPNCIILNCMMCGEEGFCLYRHFKSEAAFRDIPVIMLSSVSRDILFQFRSMAGAFGGREAPEPEAFLQSPPDIDELVETVARLTGLDPTLKPATQTAHGEGSPRTKPLKDSTKDAP